MATFGDPIPILRRASSSTTVLASPRNGARSPSTSPASTTPIRALTTSSTISRRWAVRPGPAARGPLASRTIGRRITSSYSATPMRSRDRSATPSPTSCGISSRPASAAALDSSRTRRYADDYMYWNAGLTLGFMERWSADVRYYDTTYNEDRMLPFKAAYGATAMRGRWVPSRPRSRHAGLPQSTSSKGAVRGALFYCGGVGRRCRCSHAPFLPRAATSSRPSPDDEGCVLSSSGPSHATV